MQGCDDALTSHNNNFVFEVQVHFVDEIIHKIGRTQRSTVRDEGRRPVTTLSGNQQWWGRRSRCPSRRLIDSQGNTLIQY
jgi:hypothetical protein